MLSQKVAQQSFRRVAVQHPFALRRARTSSVSPISIAVGWHIQARHAASSVGQSTDPTKILAQQRLNRPVAPHLTIYRPQITWYLSALNRITGAALSGGLYVFASAYLVAPLFGWHLESASLAAAFGALPVIAKILLKTTVALPVTFHSLNGIRHLTWDFGRLFTNQQVIKSGWTVVGLSVASALYLAFL